MQKQAFFFTFFTLFLLVSLALIGLQRVPFLQEDVATVTATLEPLQRASYIALVYAVGKNNPQQATQAKITQFQQQINQLQTENTALKDQFATANPSPSTLLPAAIIGMPRFLPGVSQPEEIIVDKGSHQGVKNGTVVVIKNMLVGKVTQVQPYSSIVSLLTNPDTSFTARTITTNANGIVQGIGGGKSQLENVLLSDTLDSHDIIVTKGDIDASGQGFPPDLIVGEISSINKEPSALFQSAAIQQLFTVTKLTTVFLLLRP